MLRAGIIRGEHDSCTQTVPFAMAASKYQTEVEFHYLSAKDIHKENAEMTQDDVIAWAAQFDSFIFLTHAHQGLPVKMREIWNMAEWPNKLLDTRYPKCE